MPARLPLARRSAVAVLVAATLAGCASFAPDGGFGPVRDAVQERIGKEDMAERWKGDPIVIG